MIDKLDDFLILWFEINHKMVATACTVNDIKKGTVNIKVVNDDKDIVNYGTKPLSECKFISKFRFEGSWWNQHLVKWNERSILLSKYPYLLNILL